MYKRDIEDEDMDDEFSHDDSSEKEAYSPGQPENVNEVFGFENEDDEDGDENEDEDISAEPYSDIPDTRAWGKNKKAYYSSDYVDNDFGTLTERDEKNAEAEEEEARNIQKRLAKELDDVDFGLDIIADSQPESKTDTSHVVKFDLSKFTNREKLEFFQKESPEFAILVQDIKDQLNEVKATLCPHLEHMKEGDNSNNPSFLFIQAKYQAILHYCVNILFYLTLKSKRLFSNSHPVIKRLAQYRQMLNQLESVEENALSNLQKMAQRKVSKSSSRVSNEFSDQKVDSEHDDVDQESDEEQEGGDNMEGVEATSTDNMVGNQIDEYIDRRSITYQISKNKGLTPHRSKEQRNPRVKHRNKYRKAMIRRKGAVRESRKEIRRYAGEISGIKAGLKKSISLK